VIGFDFINRFVDEIDFDGRVLTLHDPKTFRYAGPGTAVPITLAGATPVVKMKLDGELEGDFRVDVGSGSTVDLHTPFVAKHGLEARATRSVDATGGGFGGTFVTRVVRMKKLELGPYSWADPLVTLSQAKEGAFTSEDYAGNIGNRILERFRVTLDYERRQMWLEPGRLYPRRDPMTRAGMQLTSSAGTVKVAELLKGSPAERAGLRSGDVVTALDGRPVLELGPDRVSEILDEGAEGSVHTFAVLRDGKTKKIKVTLKEML
jgi:membrane-associated protease RseP (regulator of RpoE activity)